MEVVTSQTLWEGYDPSLEELEVNIARVDVGEKFTVKKVYFTGRTFADGCKTRVCATICAPNKKYSHGVLMIGSVEMPITLSQMQDMAKSGFVAMTIDLQGRTNNGCGTLYPRQVEFCNQTEGKDMFYFQKTPMQSKVYEQALCCMRAVTYLYQEEKIKTLSVFTVGEGSILGAIVCSKDSRVTNGAFLFGSLNVDYPQQNADELAELTETEKSQKIFEYNDRLQLWTNSLAPQNYVLTIKVPIYVINSANSCNVDIMVVNKMYQRLNRQSRLLIVPDMFDCLPAKYYSGIIAWFKGTTVENNQEVSFDFVNGELVVNINATAKPKDVALWYCLNGESRAKHWVKASLTAMEDGFCSKLVLYQPNCTVLAFAEIGGKVSATTSIVETSVQNATVHPVNNVIFMGEGNNDLIPIMDNGVWLCNSTDVKRKKGYLGIVGAQGCSFATFAIGVVCKAKRTASAVTFDISSNVKQQLTVYEMTNFGSTNEVYVCNVTLNGDGKWQRITIDNNDFRSIADGKTLPETSFADLLVLQAEQTILVNNVILL